MSRVVTYDELPFGFSWLLDEALTRTSHAIDTGDGVWLIDPVDVPEAIERARALGPPAGVIQLLDRHNRDCAVACRRGSASRTCGSPAWCPAARSPWCRCSTCRAGTRSRCGGPSRACSSSRS